MNENIAQDAANKTSEIVANNASRLEAYIGSGVFAFLVKLIGVLAVVFFMIIVSKAIAMVVRRRILKYSVLPEEKHSDQIADLIGDIVYYSLIIFSIFIGFQLLGFDVGLILGGVSFGVGLAFKEVLGNMIAGIMILSTKELKLGDIVEIGTSPTYFGRIEEITIRYTTIRTFDLRQVVLPNTTLINTPIKTFSAESKIKLSSIIPVHYETDIELATKVIIEAVNSCSFIISPEKTKVFVTNFGDIAIELKAIFYFDPNGGLLIEYAIGEANEKINAALKKNNFAIPYPHTVITFDSGDNNLLSTMAFTAKSFK